MLMRGTHRPSKYAWGAPRRNRVLLLISLNTPDNGFDLIILERSTCKVKSRGGIARSRCHRAHA